MTPWSSDSSSDSDAIVGYRTFVAVVAAAYVTLIALTPRTDMMMQPISWAQLLPLSALYLLLGISGFDYARRRSSVPISLAYLLIEFAIGMRINTLAWSGSLPLILLPLAAQAVILLPRVLAVAMCLLVIAGVSGNLSWVPAWPHWLRNIAQATAAVVFVVVYVGVAQREREARQRTEALAAEVAQLAAANERNRMLIGQLVVCAILMFGAGLFLRTVINLRTQDLGYERDVLLIPIAAERPGQPPEAVPALVEQMRQRIGAIPGVVAAGAFASPLLDFRAYWVDGSEQLRTERGEAAAGTKWTFAFAGPGFFDAVGMK